MEKQFWVLQIYHAELKDNIQPLDIRLVSETEDKVKDYADQLKGTEYWRNEKGFPVIRIYKTDVLNIFTLGSRLGINKFFLDSYYPEGVINGGKSFFLGEGVKKEVSVFFGNHGCAHLNPKIKKITIK
jgi:hypothetical protein